MTSENRQIVFATIFSIAVFVADLITPLGVAVATMHIVGLFILLRAKSNKAIWLFTIIVSLLTVMVVFFNLENVSLSIIINRSISLLSIWVSAFLLLLFRKLQHKIKQNKLGFKSIVDSTIDAVITANQKGHIISWNPGAEKMFGWKKKEAIGKPLSIIIPDRLKSSHEEGLSRYIASGQAQVIGKVAELVAINKDGDEFPVELSLGAWKVNDKFYFSGIVRDITERAAAAEKVAQYNKALKAKTQESEEFVYAVSHDLKAPVRTIKSFVSFLQAEYGKQLDRQAHEYMQYIIQATDRMHSMIIELLDYSQIGKKRKLKKIDCKALVKNVLEDLNSKISETQASIEIDELPVLHAYETELRLLFQNLLSNALKFQKQGNKPKILVQANEQNSDWVFTVKDNGIGIEKDCEDRIFGIFKRLHNSQEYPGMGIGLAHCKKIVTMHKGAIWVESNPGNGSIFYFSIPINLQNRSAQETENF